MKKAIRLYADQKLRKTVAKKQLTKERFHLAFIQLMLFKSGSTFKTEKVLRNALAC